MKGVTLRDVVFAGGQLRFRVPTDWKESPEEDGSAAFHDESADGGTLRAKVITFTTEEDLSGRTALMQLEDMEPAPGQTLEELPNGNAVRAHEESGDGDGDATELRIWLLASVDPPHRLHLAIFSFTVLTKDAAAAEATIALLDREIRAARFAHQIS
jgi:hypothetical protein